MGSGRFAGDGSSSDKVARNFKRNFAKWIFDRLFAGGDCGAIFASGVGMAADVLDRRPACAPRALHSNQSARIRSMEAAPRSLDWSSIASGRGTVAAVPISSVADDVYDVSFARNTGLVSRLFAGSAQSFRS